MKWIFLLLALPLGVMAMNDVSVPHTFSDSGIIYASEHNNNFDTLKTAVNKNKDTLETKFIRFTDLTSGDSTLTRLQVDSIRGNPDIDSIQGLNVIRGNPDIDSISGSPKINAVTVIGTASVDSLFSTKGVEATTGTFSGTVNMDSLKSTKGMNATTGGFSGTVSVDSLKSTKSVNATGGFFSSTVRVDSLHSTKGVKATTGTYSGAVTAGGTASVDSLFSTKGIKATTGTFSGAVSFGGGVTFSSTVSADSLFSTKGIKGTTGNFSSTVTGAEINYTSLRKSGSSYTADYDFFSSVCTLITDAGYTTATINGVKFGKFVTFMLFSGAYGIRDSITGTPAYLGMRAGSLPAAVRPVGSNGEIYGAVPIIDNGTHSVGTLRIMADGSMQIYKADRGNFSNSTSATNYSGIPYGITFSYYLY